MNDFVAQEWQSFCTRLTETARHLASGQNDFEKQFMAEAENFIGHNKPMSYTELLTLTVEGTKLAINWQEIADQKTTGQKTTGREKTYTYCDNHVPMPVPTETMAEQAEQVRSQA